MSIDVRRCEVENQPEIACDTAGGSATELLDPERKQCGCVSHGDAGPEIKPATIYPARRGGFRPGAGRKPKRHEIEHPPSIDPLPGLHWYCARTEYAQETFVDIGMRRAGFRTYLPQFLQKAAVHPDGRIKRGSYDRIVPLFPRYMFVQLDLTIDDWRRVYVPGVERLFGAGPERPTPVPQRAIDILLGQAAVNGVIYPEPFKPIEPGTCVEILDGPFDTWRAICLLSEPDRIRVLVEIFGRETKVDMKPTQVRVI